MLLLATEPSLGIPHISPLQGDGGQLMQRQSRFRFNMAVTRTNINLSHLTDIVKKASVQSLHAYTSNQRQRLSEKSSMPLG
jgi:hypothetical protein